MRLKEFAEREGISVQRAATLARQGRIPAHKEGKTWIVDDCAVLERRARRPLSKQSQDDFLQYLADGTLDHTKGTRKKRLAERVRLYRGTADPAALLREWWGDTVPEGRGGPPLFVQPSNILITKSLMPRPRTCR